MEFRLVRTGAKREGAFGRAAWKLYAIRQAAGQYVRTLPGPRMVVIHARAGGRTLYKQVLECSWLQPDTFETPLYKQNKMYSVR